MALDPVIRAKVREILLNHKGKKNAIYAREIAAQVGIKENATRVVTRGYITDILRRDGLPIGATVSGGYFLIETAAELFEYVATLDKRILETEDRKARVMNNFESHTGIEILPADESEEDDPEQ